MVSTVGRNKYYDRKNKYYDSFFCRSDRNFWDYTCANGGLRPFFLSADGEMRPVLCRMPLLLKMGRRGLCHSIAARMREMAYNGQISTWRMTPPASLSV